MDNFIGATFRAIRSLFTPGMFSVFILSILFTIAALVGFICFSGVLFGMLGAHMHDTIMGHFIAWAGTIGSTMLAWFLFPGITPIFVNFFDDRIAKLIEKHDYPTATPARQSDFWKEFWHDLRFSLKAILLNILVLPLYLLPVLNLCLFYILNGYLLGREYFVMVALRHMPVEQAEALRKSNSRTVMTAGITLTVLATIPIANLFAPFWGVAMMVHLYHKIVRTPDAQLLPPPSN